MIIFVRSFSRVADILKKNSLNISILNDINTVFLKKKTNLAFFLIPDSVK